MKSRIYARQKSTREQTSDFSTAPAQPMFQPRPFVVQPQMAEPSQQPDFKTSLRQAERYGHHLSRMQPTGGSAPKAVQPKLSAKAPQVLQAKQTVGEPRVMCDPEADEVADRVVDRLDMGGDRASEQESAQKSARNHSEQDQNRSQPPAPLGLNITRGNAVVQRMPVRIDEKGKVRSQARDARDGAVLDPRKYVDIPNNEFANWKNAGKQKPSNKVTDPETDTHYYNKDGKFYEWEKNNKLGKEIKGQQLKELQEKLNNGHLIDRRREDRRKSPVKPFDVAPYDKNYNNYNFGAEPAKIAADRDHVPSGESINRRTKTQKEDYYHQGVAISIPADYHKDFSPTLSGRQHVKDKKSDGTEDNRVNIDAKNPAVGAYRDTFHMLDETKQFPAYRATIKDDPKKFATYDRLKQMGGYRYMFKLNQRLYETQNDKDKKAYGHGVNFGVEGQNYNVIGHGNPGTPRKTDKSNKKEQPIFEYTKAPPIINDKNAPPKSQGELMAEGFEKRLKDHFTPQAPPTPSTNPAKRPNSSSSADAPNRKRNKTN